MKSVETKSKEMQAFIEHLEKRDWLAARIDQGQVASVPCNGCTRCCHGDAIRILPHEDASQWETEKGQTLKGDDFLILKHKANGDCFYLGETGCTIQGVKPYLCRIFDCREVAKKLSFTQARKLAKKGSLHIGVYNRGRELLKVVNVE